MVNLAYWLDGGMLCLLRFMFSLRARAWLYGRICGLVNRPQLEQFFSFY